MWETIALGIGSSIAAEIVFWLNKKLSGTVLKGTGAFLFATAVAFVVALVKVGFSGVNFSWSELGAFFSQVFTVSQVWFYLITSKLGLVVQPSDQQG